VLRVEVNVVDVEPRYFSEPDASAEQELYYHTVAKVSRFRGFLFSLLVEKAN
jgi:hypothetical protein